MNTVETGSPAPVVTEITHSEYVFIVSHVLPRYLRKRRNSESTIWIGWKGFSEEDRIYFIEWLPGEAISDLLACIQAFNLEDESRPWQGLIDKFKVD